MKSNIKNPPYLEDKVALEDLEDMYAIANKQQPREDTLTTQSNTVGIYYNVVKKEHAMEYEEVLPCTDAPTTHH